jgi:hypothetical protein
MPIPSILNPQSSIFGRDGTLPKSEEGGMTMMDLKVILDFACCCCGQPMSVTVQCTGKGLAAGTRTVAAVNVPCPTCSSVNQLYFEPSGRIHAVAPFHGVRPVPEPSVN